jgi:uncharacterized protein Smg (DUF494 family)
MISKSTYLIGLQCPLWLWKQVKEPESLLEPDDFTKSLFETGYEVEQLANTLFKKESLQKTITFKDCQARLDVLDNGELIEIKSSNEVKKIHHEDLAFQLYLCQKNNIEVKSCFVLHLNNEYIKQGDIDTQQLFLKTDVTEEVLTLLPFVEEKLQRIRDIIAGDCPSPVHQCKPAYSCPAHEQYFKELPLGNVFELSRGKAKAFKLAQQGIFDLKEITSQIKLTDKQYIQCECAKSGQPYIHKAKINAFLESLEYPIYYLDFETVSFAIPKWDGTRPYQQICVQHSCHIEHEDGKIEHKEFLFETGTHPSKPFAENLREVLGDKGSIVVYNQSFEEGRLKELARDYPEFEEWINQIRERLVDLLVPFREFAHYHPSQKGSASIKKVLPTLTDLDYSDLEVANGSTAMRELAKLVDVDNPEMRKHLLKYCELDTWAEVEIVRKLRYELLRTNN